MPFKRKKELKIQFAPVSFFSSVKLNAMYYNVVEGRVNAITAYLKKRGKERADELDKIAKHHFMELVKDGEKHNLTVGEMELILASMIVSHIINLVKQKKLGEAETPYVVADSIYYMVCDILLDYFNENF